MGKIYSGVKDIPMPEFTSDFKEYEKQMGQYVKKIQSFAKEFGKCPEAGEILSFSVADGSAHYVVLSLKPVELIHLDTYDGYMYQYVNRLTAKDIRSEIKNRKAWEKLFSKTK